MIKGFLVNDGFNARLARKSGDDVLFTNGLRTYDVTGKGVETPFAVLESLHARMEAKNIDGYVPVYIGYYTGWILMHADTFEISGKANVPRNWSPITSSWTLCYDKRTDSLVNCETSVERKLGSSFVVARVIDEHVFLLSTVKIDQNHRVNPKTRKLGKFDAQNNKWLYSVKLKGPVKVASGQVLLEKFESEILIRKLEDGKVCGRFSDVDATPIRECQVVENSIAVQTQKAIYTLDLSTNEQKEVLFEDFGTGEYSLSLKPDGFVVFFQENEVVRVYNLPILEFEEFEIPFNNIRDDLNGYVVVDKVGEYLTFTRRVKSEESSGLCLHVRYFYNPSESTVSDAGVEPIKAHCKKIVVENGLHQYKLFFDKKTDFDTFYRQAVSYIEGISLEYGFEIGTAEPYDEMWTGQLIVDTSGQEFSDANYTDLKKLMAYMEWKLLDIAKPTVGKDPKVRLTLK